MKAIQCCANCGRLEEGHTGPGDAYECRVCFQLRAAAARKAAGMEPQQHSYLVRWEIDIDANTPEEAAAKAAEIQADPESIATHFEVVDQCDPMRRVHDVDVRRVLQG